MCPSSRAKEGSQLLGVRQENGTIAILPQPLPVDQESLEKFKNAVTPPEQNFRFTNKCVENGCKQWNGKSCGVSERVMVFLNKIPVDISIPECSIRNRCRWFVQSGADACKICPYIITEITEEEVQRYNDKINPEDNILANV